LQNAKQNNPVNSTTTVSWSDNVNKTFTLQASLAVKNDKNTLTITRADKNLQPPNFD